MSDARNGDWHGRVWRLAGPIILSNVSVPLLGIVDTAVVGHLPGPQYIGAVAVGAMIFSVVYIGFNFLRMGTTGITAQALGANDPDEVRATLARAIIVAVVLGIALVVIQRPIAWIAFPLVDAGDNVESLADAYYSIRIWGAPAALINFAFLGWFIGIQNTRAALILQIAMNGINIVLDLWFVLGLGLGVEGVAYATLISEVGAVVLGVWLMGRSLPAIGGAWRRASIIDGGRTRRLLAINRDIFIRTICLMLSFAVFTALGARLGVTVLAANAVLMNLQVFMAYALDGFAFAVESLAGAALGARDSRAFPRRRQGHDNLGAGLFALFYGVLRARRRIRHRRHHRHRRGARSGAPLPAVGGGGAADLGVELPARRHLHRRHPQRRHAQYHGHLGGRLRIGAGGAGPAPRQPRTVARLHGADGGARHHAGRALPGDCARLGRRRFVSVTRRRPVCYGRPQLNRHRTRQHREKDQWPRIGWHTSG